MSEKKFVVMKYAGISFYRINLQGTKQKMCAHKIGKYIFVETGTLSKRKLDFN